MVAVPLSASLCAYGFTKLKFPGRDFVFSATLATIMIPGSVTQVPLYIMFSRLGWVNGPLCMTIPALFGGGAMTIFLFMQFMRSVPFEIENAAKIDGANVFQRYFNITMPLCKPIIIYTIIGTFSGGWSDFYGPLVYLKSRDQFTLALVIYYDSINTNVAMEVANVRMAAGVFMSIPPILLFFFYQKNLIEGIQIGSLKG
jgi:multiple sugar transport system permease protein